MHSHAPRKGEEKSPGFQSEQDFHAQHRERCALIPTTRPTLVLLTHTVSKDLEEGIRANQRKSMGPRRQGSCLHGASSLSKEIRHTNTSQFNGIASPSSASSKTQFFSRSPPNMPGTWHAVKPPRIHSAQDTYSWSNIHMTQFPDL